MGGGEGDPASGSRSRRGGPGGHRRLRHWPTPARTPPAGAARYTSAARHTHHPRRGSARSPTGGPPGSVPGRPAWRPGRPSRVRPGPAGRASSRSRRPGAPPVAGVARRPRRGCPTSPPEPVVAVAADPRSPGELGWAVHAVRCDRAACSIWLEPKTAYPRTILQQRCRSSRGNASPMTVLCYLGPCARPRRSAPTLPQVAPQTEATPGRSELSRVAMTVSAASTLGGWPATAATNSSRPRAYSSRSVCAVTVAVRGRSRSRAISPK
jgi:hypothetical protein